MCSNKIFKNQLRRSSENHNESHVFHRQMDLWEIHFVTVREKFFQINLFLS